MPDRWRSAPRRTSVTLAKTTVSAVSTQGLDVDDIARQYLSRGAVLMTGALLCDFVLGRAVRVLLANVSTPPVDELEIMPAGSLGRDRHRVDGGPDLGIQRPDLV